MRTLTLYMAALVSVLGIASASQAAIIIDFLIGGQTSAAVAPSASITVDVYLTATGSTTVSGYGISMTVDGTELDGTNTLVNGPTHATAGQWTPLGAGLYFPFPGGYGAAFGGTTANPAGASISAADGQVLIGSVKFHVLAAITDGLVDIGGCYDCLGFAGDGPTGANDLTTTFNGAQVNVIPEPTTASLLGLGLLGLTVAGRRRKN